ncbi:MAG: dihydroorotase [Armatimonadetes bacterium]|nr:dihydroorotase [Armatimonadota bacterium]
MRLLLKNGRVVDPSQGIDKVADVLVENGRVSRIGQVSDENLDTVYDVSGLVVTPGLIDIHVHLREPGQEHKETIETGARAAAAGGFTTIVGMPNTKPAIDNRAVVEYVLNKSRSADVRVLTCGAATKGNDGAEMAEIADMVDAGAVAISDDAYPVQSADLMRRIMEYCRMIDVPVVAHCEEKSMTRGGVMNEGITCTMLGVRPWPRQAEEIIIWRNILLADLARCRLHVQHVTTSGGVDAIRWAKSRGIRVTAETCPQYFSLTDEALVNYDSNAKVNPPLRTQSDIDAIKQGLEDGTIDVIATDHAPHAREEKEVELQDALFGMVGLETALPLVITNLVKPGILSLSEAVSKLTDQAAHVLGIGAGTLADGAPADITIIDPEAKITVRADEFKSMARNTPFDGVDLTGKVVATIVGGEVKHGVEALVKSVTEAAV